MISHINFMLTRRCNSKCRYCYLNAQEESTEKELELEKIYMFLECYKQNRGKSIQFTGGEPLLYPHIEEVLRYANKLGLWVTLFTNGLLLDDDIFIRIKDNVNHFVISLDGPEKVHDFNRGVKKAYQSIIKVLELFKEHKVSYSIQMTIDKFNIEYIDEIGELASNYCAKIVILANVIGQGRGHNCTDYLNNEKDLLLIKKKSKELSKKYNYRPYFSTNLYGEKEIKTYFKDNVIIPLFWVDSQGDICLFSAANKQEFKISHISNYPFLNLDKVWKKAEEIMRILNAQVFNKKICSYYGELEILVNNYKS
ncbi:MAG: radical SAM protein [Halanaerobiales bacterium]|nr:radical SAM protein [Halanaerobiales bacterium]